MTEIEKINEAIQSQPNTTKQLEMAEKILELHSQTPLGMDWDTYERDSRILVMNGKKIRSHVSFSHSGINDITKWLKLRIEVLKNKKDQETEAGSAIAKAARFIGALKCPKQCPDNFHDKWRELMQKLVLRSCIKPTNADPNTPWPWIWTETLGLGGLIIRGAMHAGWIEIQDRDIGAFFDTYFIRENEKTKELRTRRQAIRTPSLNDQSLAKLILADLGFSGPDIRSLLSQKKGV